MFEAGYESAYAFPFAAPLALLDSPLAKDELKRVSVRLRQQSLEDGKTGLIHAGSACVFPLPEVFRSLQALIGPQLDLPNPLAADASFLLPYVRFAFPQLLLCSALVLPGCVTPDFETPIPPAPSFSFRACAVANVNFRFKSGEASYIFEWKIGPLTWLPSLRSFHG
ncbi:hypothetical protein FACS1894200_14360 [Spirochaetia bacterium]|nr:hypothetical protein FACS1894200_14360 [Spirochaetia bacterium]